MKHLLRFLEKFNTVDTPDFLIDEYVKKYVLDNAYLINDKSARKRFEPIRQQLESECSKFINELKESKSDIIWRGSTRGPEESSFDMIGNKDSIIELRKVRKNRRPRDIDFDIQELFDFYARKHFNIGLRSSGVFTTKSYLDSTEYGIPFIFFPIGNYEYYWNPNIRDLYSRFEDLPIANYFISRRDDYLRDVFHEEWLELNDDPGKSAKDMDDWYDEKSREVIEEFEDYVDDIVREYKSNKSSSLGEVANQEILFICDEYYLINPAYAHFIYEMIGIQTHKID